MQTKLTQTTVKSIAPATSTFVVYDSELAGFGLRITPTGAKSWIVEYRPGGGGRRTNKKRITIGSTATLSADKARDAAQKYLARVRLGADPASERAEARASLTVAELGKRFLEEEINIKKKASTAKLYESYLRVHTMPAIGTRKARDVTHADIAKLHRKIAATGAEVTANRVVTFLSGLYTWAGKVGEIPKTIPNPAKEIERFREDGRERFLTDEEMRRLGETLALAESQGLPFEVSDETRPTAKHTPKHGRTVISAHATNAIRLLLLTGCRLREVLHLKWDDVDFAKGMFTVVDGKTGDRTVWLNAPALAVLDTLKQIRIGDYVIAGDNAEKPRADLQKPWRQVVRHAQLEDATAHTLRHSHASTGVGANSGLPLIGALLGHKNQATTAKYAHIADSPARRASETIGAVLAAAMGAGTTSADIVPIKRGHR